MTKPNSPPDPELQLNLLTPSPAATGLSPIEVMGDIDAARAHIAEFAPSATQITEERGAHARRITDPRGGEDLQAEQAPVARLAAPDSPDTQRPFVIGKVRELPNRVNGQPSTQAPPLLQQKRNARDALGVRTRERLLREITEQREEVLHTPVRSDNRDPETRLGEDNGGLDQVAVDGLASARSRLPRPRT